MFVCEYRDALGWSPLGRIAARVGLGVGQAEHEYVLLDALGQMPPPARQGAGLLRRLAAAERKATNPGHAHCSLDPDPEVSAQRIECTGPPSLVPERLSKAAVYWERDLANQVPGGSLPEWATVTRELGELLEVFFSR